MTRTQPWVERILRVLDHIQAHLDEELDPVQLAKLAGFSRHHFHRVFRGMTGESVMGLIRRLRLERAAMRLKFGDESVTEIAALSGYQSHEAFTRAFRARFLLPPSEYRVQVTAPGPGSQECFERERADATLLSLRHVGPYEQCLDAWDRLFAWAKPAGAVEQSLEMLGLCYDDPEITDAAQLRYDACISVPQDFVRQLALPSDVVERRLNAGSYVGTLHEGSYESILESYVSLLGHYLPRRQTELANEPIVEIYLTSPYEVPPEELRTEICARLAP